MKKWTSITPKQLRRTLRDHPWLFAYCYQSPTDRNDHSWYHALLFRNRDRTTFGAFESLSDSITVPEFEKRYDVRAIAARIVRDEAYRRSLVSDDPRLPALWKRH